MVIQRWQNLLLFIALILMCVFCATPYASLSIEGVAAQVYPLDAPVFFVINIFVAIMFLIGLFSFKDLKKQMRITLIGIIILCAAIITGGVLIYNGMPNMQPVYCGGMILPLVSLILAILARNFMRKDYKLLRSYDRLR